MEERIFKLDDKDREILTLLSEDPEIPQEQIAEIINLSQPSVAMRIRKLKEMGVFRKICGVNPLKLGLNIAKVDVSTTDSAKILSLFQNCPYFLNGYLVSGKSNVLLFLIGEDIPTLESIVECHLRPLKEVKEVEFNIIISAAKELNLPYQMKVKIVDRPFCGLEINCADCKNHQEKRCLGCPMISEYKGKIW
ncbi:MAG: Lrp/AsnC family transcriptional regulator [Candidatus Freyarchaeota archaeon]|nr:Lrp/AsnC family transcriptional regulator [Candidatus Jordarchaeia archaeon]